MVAKRGDLPNHLTFVSRMVGEICGATANEQLVRSYDEAGLTVVRITDWVKARSRPVTTDLGQSEPALRLPVPPDRPRLWLGLHEIWAPSGKHRVAFRECAVRLYIGAPDEEALQFLRLEWVAPTTNRSGVVEYDGKHAGHPHWHIDKAALVGQDDYLRSLEALTVPALQPEAEVFGSSVIDIPPRRIHDCSWLPRMHLPAQAGWMHEDWDAHSVPGPHQSEPDNMKALDRWWAGALRYLIAELPKAVS
jgi:hypothetical protein